VNGTACGCHELFPFLSACLAELRDDAFFAELPAALRTDIAHELAQPLLEQSDVFNCMTKSAQRVLAARLTPLAVPAGHNVAQEGDPATTLWLLQEGASAVRLTHRRPVTISHQRLAATGRLSCRLYHMSTLAELDAALARKFSLSRALLAQQAVVNM